RPLLVGAVVTLLMAVAPGSQAQDFCRGDVDDSGVVDAADVDGLLATLFGELTVTPRADVNADVVISAADIVAIIGVQGFMCPGPTRTETVSPTITMTPTITPTLTPRPTATPTQVCTVQTAHFGSNSGELTSSDCMRTFQGKLRHTDVYTIQGTPGSAIKIEV